MVFHLLKRLLSPLLILAILIALINFKDRFGYEEVSQDAYESPNQSELVTPVFSLRRAPKLLTSPLATQKLQENLQGLVNALPESSCISISTEEEQLFVHQSQLPVNPGGLQKIITAFGALDQLGNDYQYETVISADRETDEDGNLLSSDLYVFGSGDPLIRTDAYMELLPESYSQIRTSADEMADLTVGMNVLFIQGAVVVNESKYDEERTVSGWDQELKDSSSIGSLSASLLDDGFEGLKQNYSAQRGEDPDPLIPSTNPAKRFAANFDDLLEARGVIILQAAKEINNVDRDSLVELVSMKSPTLDLIVKQMLTNDDNVTAEMLLKEIGHSRTGQGTTGSGLVSIPELLAANNLSNTGLLQIDGSGLSFDNRVTCDLIQGVLESDKHGETLKLALPVAGIEGLVSDQLNGTPFQQNLSGYSFFEDNRGGLSGYYTTPDGVDIRITFIANYDDADIADETQKEFLTGLSEVLSQFTGGQPIDELGPITESD